MIKISIEKEFKEMFYGLCKIGKWSKDSLHKRKDSLCNIYWGDLCRKYSVIIDDWEDVIRKCEGCPFRENNFSKDSAMDCERFFEKFLGKDKVSVSVYQICYYGKREKLKEDLKKLKIYLDNAVTWI